MADRIFFKYMLPCVTLIIVVFLLPLSQWQIISGLLLMIIGLLLCLWEYSRKTKTPENSYRE